jgi:hypothetical protein
MENKNKNKLNCRTVARSNGWLVINIDLHEGKLCSHETYNYPVTSYRSDISNAVESAATVNERTGLQTWLNLGQIQFDALCWSKDGERCTELPTSRLTVDVIDRWGGEASSG